MRFHTKKNWQFLCAIKYKYKTFETSVSLKTWLYGFTNEKIQIILNKWNILPLVNFLYYSLWIYRETICSQMQ